jgi:hypothetical protein
MSGIPTVKFDASRVTETIKADLRKNIMLLEGVERHRFKRVCKPLESQISRTATRP